MQKTTTTNEWGTRPLVRALAMLASVGAMATLMVACGETQADPVTKPSDTATAERPAINVETYVVQPESFSDVINVVGTVKPAEDIMVAAEEGGKVDRWYVAKGAFVRAGQPLVKLNDDILRRQLEAAQVQLKTAKLNAERNRQVFDEAGAVPEVSVTTAQYSVEAAEANINLLRTRIAKTVIKAPVSGRIDTRVSDLGEMVAPGAPVARLLQTGTVKVYAGIPERYATGVRVGTPVEMVFDALEGRRMEARITYIGSSISDRDRTLGVEIEIPNPGNVSPEMVASLKVVRDVLRGALVVPRSAILRVEDGYQVYVVVPGKGGSVIEARPVKLGPADNGRVVITEGLGPNDRIVTVGQAKVNPGERVSY